MSEIVLAIRLGRESHGPAAVAAELARHCDGCITVLFVATELAAADLAAAEAGLDPRQEHERITQDAEAQLRRFAETHLPGITAETRVVQGRVEEVVPDVARELGARFIVVGTHSRSKLARLVLGDTVQAVLQRTPCPVVVVPVRDQAG